MLGGDRAIEIETLQLKDSELTLVKGRMGLALDEDPQALTLRCAVYFMTRP